MKYLLQLLLGAKVVGVSTLLLAAVDGTGMQTGIAPATQAVRGKLRKILLNQLFEVVKTLIIQFYGTTDLFLVLTNLVIYLLRLESFNPKRFRLNCLNA